MDKIVVSALNQLPICAQHLEEISICCSGAEATFRSARQILESGDETLTGARMERFEKLLRELRESQRQFGHALRKLEKILEDGMKRPERQKAVWDKLPDSWWKGRVVCMAGIVEGVSHQEGGLKDLLEGRLGEGGDAFAERVGEVGAAVRRVEGAWGVLMEDVKGWEDVAKAVVGGVGMSASFIPG